MADSGVGRPVGGRARPGGGDLVRWIFEGRRGGSGVGWPVGGRARPGGRGLVR